MNDTERIARLDAIRKRVQADIDAPWDYSRKQDQAFLNHAREDIPWLLAEIERLKKGD